jgi:pSer/pThr/pTyr-binding forkhead associated (FHA) protein
MVMLALLAWLLGRRRRPLPEPPILARLELLNSVAAGKLAVRAPVFRIGRARSNDLRLTNDSVSAYHAELHRHRDGTFAVIDLGSTNGVWVNGEQVRNHSLRDGDVLELGEVRLRFWQVP